MKEKKYKKICLSCGKEYLAYTDKSRFCSKYCQGSFLYKQTRKLKPKIYINKICEYCGNEFQCESYKVQKRFCSDECRKKSYRIRNGKSIIDDTALDTLRKQVSLKVQNIITKSNNQGDTFNNVAINYYLLNDIPLNTRTLVLERDYNKCQICNSRNNLHIHHIIKRKDGGNHEPENLITLCASCHRHIEIGDIDYATNKCFENAKNNYYNNGVINTLERDEIISQLSYIFDDVKNNYTNCTNLLILIDELIDKI